MIGNILDNTTELYMIKYRFGEIFSSGRGTLYKNPSDQTVGSLFISVSSGECEIGFSYSNWKYKALTELFQCHVYFRDWVELADDGDKTKQNIPIKSIEDSN